MRATIRGTIAALAVVVGTTAGTAVLAPAGPAGAAGVTTHAWMALEAIDLVDSPQLAALLDAHRDQVRAGAQFPDGGYFPGNVYGEEAHWQRFHDAYADLVRAKAGCGDLADPAGPCAAEVAHLMGVAAHGMGDEAWDWLFEPYSPDLDEYYLPEELSPFQDGGGQELTMDLVAIARHGQPLHPNPAAPSVPDLLAAFEAGGYHDATADQLANGHTVLDVIHDVEGGWAPHHIDPLLEAMPWMAHNMVTAPGGVQWAAQAIAGYWDSLWGRLLGDQPATEVSVTYPADGQRRIPAAGWERSFQPGSSPGRGGARNRIAAALTSSRPYAPDAGNPIPIPSQLPDGAMTLTDLTTDLPVAPMAGYPRSVPYGPDAGEHLIDLQPAADLTPCTWYRVDVTDVLVDARGEPVVPASWTFRTGADVAGSRCPDDPFTADERWAMEAVPDLVGREAEPDEVGAWVARLERGETRTDLADRLLDGPEGKARLVRDAYRRTLDREPDTGGLAYWTATLATRSVRHLEASLLGSAEAFAAAGGSDGQWIAAAYEVALGRLPDPAGGAFWAAQLDGGLSRSVAAKRMLATYEGRRHLVARAFQALVHHDPDGSGWAYWANRPTVDDRGDPRRLWAALVGSAEYLALAQQP